MSENGERGALDAGRWEEALTWYSTLREAEKRDLGDAVGREWQRWYSNAENRRLFDDVSRLLCDRDRYIRRPRPTKSEIEIDHYDASVPIAEWRRTQGQRQVRERRLVGRGWTWWLSGGIGTAAVVALCVMWPLRFESGGPLGPVDYQTEIGGLKDVRLSDGSSIILGARTKLAVEFSAKLRSVSLIQGQAWFKVAHDPHWPFMVAAGDGTITDIGTAFLVTRESDRVVVTVTEGAVEVATMRPILSAHGLDQGASPRPAITPIRVHRGEELAVGDDGTLGRVKPTDTRAATAWTYGTLTFDNVPLRYVIEAVDRYSSRQIVVTPSASALRFTGIVHSDEIEEWLRSLEVIFPVSVREYRTNVRIDKRAPGAGASRPATPDVTVKRSDNESPGPGARKSP